MQLCSGTSRTKSDLSVVEPKRLEGFLRVDHLVQLQMSNKHGFCANATDGEKWRPIGAYSSHAPHAIMLEDRNICMSIVQRRE
jgi:hypothetical protein